jgi:hypothetical protein
MRFSSSLSAALCELKESTIAAINQLTTTEGGDHDEGHEKDP